MNDPYVETRKKGSRFSLPPLLVAAAQIARFSQHQTKSIMTPQHAKRIQANQQHTSIRFFTAVLH